MRMKTCIVLLTLLVAMPVMADVTFLFGDQFAGVEVTKRFDQIEVGGVAAVDYFFDSHGVGDISVDVQDNYVGPTAKLHFAREDAPIDPFVGVGWLIRNSDLTDHYLPLEAGVLVKVVGDVRIGLSYVYCADFKKDDRWMIRLSPWLF